MHALSNEMAPKKPTYKYVQLQGTSKVQNEIETTRNDTKQNLPKRNYQNMFKNH